jgi:FKBP-type peptidyl-prolyl cis-trans isomerase
MRRLAIFLLIVGAATACKKSGPAAAESASAASLSATAAGKAPTVTTALSNKVVPAPDNVAAAPPDAVTATSGLASVLLEKGTGTEVPSFGDRVRVHYSGWTRDGKMIVSTTTRNRPHTLTMEPLKDSWEGEALSKMVVGEKRRFWVPGNLPRASMSRRATPEQATTFDVTLLEIIKVPEPPAVPEDVAAPPKDAKRTKSGIAYKVLKKGEGTVHPQPTQRVEVHYTGWTTDGKMFDSSVPRGRTSTFGLNQVIKGWTEGVQLMVEGEKMRFWIPGPLAYGDKPSRPGAPAGMLVFDIELVKVR